MQVQRVLAEISASTGLQFAYAGRTSSRASTTPDGALDAASVATSGADLVVQWEQRGSASGLLARSPGLAGVGTAAVSGGYVVLGRGVISRDPTRIRAAAVALDVQESAAAVRPGRARAGVGLHQLLLHELGHAVGLEHTADPGTVMFPTLHRGGPRDYTAGDLAGLSRVGSSGGCLQPHTVTLGGLPAG